MVQRYTALGRVEVSVALEAIRKHFYENGPSKIDVGGHSVSVASTRLRTFMEYGVTCKHCGRIGQYFELNSNGSGTHLNLWVHRRLLMTSDHIVPVSRGGPKENIRNRQPLCQPCNQNKGSFDPTFVGPVYPRRLEVQRERIERGVPPEYAHLSKKRRKAILRLERRGAPDPKPSVAD